MNKLMKELVEHINDKDKQNIIFSSSSLDKLFNPLFKRIYDCIIVSEEDIDFTSQEDFINTIKENYQDKTYFERWYNETLINSYINDDNLKVANILPVAFTVMSVWAIKLKSMEPNSKFCFIVSCDCEEEFVDMRFHKVREDESLGINEDLEGYNQPIAYAIV